tara:strand:- start:514 stop:2211 length:1698 start_codon:yes stop_codon:yes gene_type:complete
MKQKYIINIFILLILIISSFLLLYKLNNQNIVGIDEFKYIDWSINIFSEKAVLNYFRPVFYIVSNISTNLFEFSFNALKIPNFIFFLFSILLIIKISKKYFQNEYFLFIPLIFFIFNPTILREHTVLSPFSITNFFILLNVFLIFKITENNKEKKLFFILGVVNILGSFCREELIFLCLLNIFFFLISNNIKYLIRYYLLGLILTIIPFLILFIEFIEIKKLISIALNVVDKEISGPIRNTYYKIDNQENLNFLFILPKNLNRLFSEFFLIKELFIFILIFYVYLIIFNKENIGLKTKYLLIITITYLIFYFYIRVGSRLFIFYEFFFITLLIKKIEEFKIKKFLNDFKIFVILILISFIQIYYNFKNNGYSNLISVNKILHDKIIQEYQANDKIFISPTSNSLIHSPLKYFNGEPSENFSLTSKIFFGKNALLINDILDLNNTDDEYLKNFITKSNIKFLIFEVHTKNSYQILKRENEKKFLNILNINFNDKNKYFKYDMSEYLYLKKYGADLNDYFVVNSNTFNKLLVSKLQTKQMFLFKNNLLRRIKEYKEEPGIYLFFLRS